MNQSKLLVQIFQALEFAAKKHKDQRRKDAEASPYINHPIALAAVLSRDGGVEDINVLVAAILHDTLEDTLTTTSELELLFGQKITSIILEVTDDVFLTKQERKQLQVDNAHLLSYEARLVKLADKICNVHDVIYAPPADWSQKRRQEYVLWAKTVVDKIRGTHLQLENIFDALTTKHPC